MQVRVLLGQPKFMITKADAEAIKNAWEKHIRRVFGNLNPNDDALSDRRYYFMMGFLAARKLKLPKNK